MSQKIWQVKEPSQLESRKRRNKISLLIFNLVSLSKQVHQSSVCFTTSWQIELVCTKCAFKFHDIQSNASNKQTENNIILMCQSY